MKDVAALADVSPKTVSNVLHGVVRVAPATRERVEAAIDRLGYVPNLSARGLRSGRTGIVALVMPELRTPFSAQVSQEFVELAHEHGLAVQLEQSWKDLDRTREVVAQARRHLVDGVVMNPVTDEQSDEVLSGRGAAVPFVLLGEVLQDDVDQVWVDSVEAARAMTRRLLELGHRRIAIIGAPGPDRGTETGRLRRDGYRAALAEAGIRPDPALERPCAHWTTAGGAAATEALLADRVPFDAVFCCTDSIALGALSALWAAGLRVPDDVSVVGFDDIEEAAYAVPPLTTVRFDRREYARAALDRLVARMAGLDEPAVRTVIPAGIVERASTRAR